MVGIRVQNLDAIDSLYKCPYCSLLLRDTVQIIDCGHRICQSCMNEQQGEIIICSECGEKTSKDKLKLDRGFKNDMQNLTITCSLCNWTDVLKNYQNHLDQVHPNPICDYCNQKFTSVNNLDQHILYNCEKITVYCPLKTLGCDEMVLRVNLKNHYLSGPHQTVLINFIRQLKSKSFITMNNYLKINTINVINQLQEVNETIDILSGGVETLNEDIQRLKSEIFHRQNEFQPVTQELPILKKSIEEQNASIDGIKYNQDVLEQDIPSIKQKINDMRSTSHDGTFIWQISCVQEKIVAAQSDKQTSIYSPPFYSSPTGYKMCLRLYLDGDGNARRTHISLFFVLMRGEYDAILKFPFFFKVIFCLYDQFNHKNHIIDAFRPDVKSNSFQQPRSDMNIGSGISKFAPVTIFQQENNPYIRDDTMFIKVMIDFDDMCKTILPYALSLNPGLTNEIQQAMIRKELEKQQQQQISNSSMTNNEIKQSMKMDLQSNNKLLDVSSNKKKEHIDLLDDDINRMKD